MDNVGLIGMISIVVAGMTIAIGSIGVALGEGWAVARAMGSLASSPMRRPQLRGRSSSAWR